ncbi:IclR family transcriptional regulator [Curtobacterium sp. RRHDQ66]|uniref:IclR family transcriptional regulator n=1 Tax=Curtobacterium guangdongense TaxID=3413380 RepID=UPI003BEF9A0A
MPKAPAADSTLRILTVLGAQRGPMAATVIATRLGLPRSTVYQLLATLVDHGFVIHLPESRRYALGLASFELGSGFTRQQPLSLLGAPLLATLVDRTGESAHLAVMHGAEVVYVVEERARHRPTLITEVGVRLPAHLTASGKAMLAALPPAQLRALYPSDSAFVSRTGTGPSDGRALRAELALIREAGVATEVGAVTQGLASVGVAVLDGSGWPVASVACTYRSDDDGTPPDGLVQEVARVAGELSRRIGGSDGPAQK